MLVASLCVEHLDQFVGESLCFGGATGFRITESSQEVTVKPFTEISFVLLYRIFLSLFVLAV